MTRSETRVAASLLHDALNDYLGKPAKRLGASMKKGRLRLVFDHDRELGPAALDAIEAGANALVRRNDEMDGCRAGDIGVLVVFREGSPVGKDARWIEALTGHAALDYLRGRERLVAEASDALKASPGDVPARARALASECREMKAEIARLRRALEQRDEAAA